MAIVHRLLWLGCALALVLAACAEPRVRKRTFIGQAPREQASMPLGLNPLGSLDTCEPATDPQPQGNVVLVSRPEFFTADASRMISALRDAFADPVEGLPAVTFLLSPQRIETEGEAIDQGLRCGALITLWEPGQTKTLRITLPHPTQIPLRSLARERICEFGNHQEQLQILYRTIAGLLAMRENDYERAVFYLEQANRLDDHCLQLPGAPVPEPPTQDVPRP